MNQADSFITSVTAVKPVCTQYCQFDFFQLLAFLLANQTLYVDLTVLKMILAVFWTLLDF